MPKTTSPAALLKKLDSFPWKNWDTSLGKNLSQPYRDLVVAQGKKAAAAAGGQWDPTDPLLDKFMTGYVMERATQLNATTREAVADVIRSVFAHEAPADTDLTKLVKETVEERFEGYQTWRAERIARSESAIGYNHANVLGYAQADVEEVEVLDGTEDDACAEANGQTWTLREALSEPIAHPNCTRVFLPIVNDEARLPGETLSLDDVDLPFLCAIATELILAREDPCGGRVLEPIDEE